jgi:hypothetical protein
MLDFLDDRWPLVPPVPMPSVLKLLAVEQEGLAANFHRQLEGQVPAI